eukprot:213056-Amphidinium_carterae.1
MAERAHRRHSTLSWSARSTRWSGTPGAQDSTRSRLLRGPTHGLSGPRGGVSRGVVHGLHGLPPSSAVEQQHRV